MWKLAIQVNILNKFALFCKKIEFILDNCSKTHQIKDSYQCYLKNFEYKVEKYEHL